MAPSRCPSCHKPPPPPSQPQSMISTMAQYVKTKLLSPIADQSLQRRRYATCMTCLEVVRGDKGIPTSELLPRKVDGKLFCGRPRIEKIAREETREGCGCDLSDKTRYLDAACPRGRWGPGPNFRQVENVDVAYDGDVKVRIIDIFTQSQEYRGTNNGLGDTVGMLPVVWELQKKVGTQFLVRYRMHPGNMHWALYGWPYIAPENDVRFGNGIECHYPVRASFVDVDIEAEKLGITRHEMWARRCGLDQLPRWPWNPTIGEQAQEWALKETALARSEDRPVVILAPWSHHRSRTWELIYWIQLQQELAKNAIWCAAMDGPAGGERLRAFPCTRYFGIGPEYTAALMQQADLVISNDSGMAHFSGLLGVPTLAICGCTNGNTIFDWYGNVTTYQAPGACAGCYFRKERGYKYHCFAACELLLDAKPHAVLAEVERLLGERVRKPQEVEYAV